MPKMTLKQWLDIPPAWLALMIAIAWAQAEYLPMGLAFVGYWADFLGGILLGGGLILMGLAFVEMRKHRTTLIPHQDASHMVQTGIFKRTRNPIYIGDMLILAGLILRMDAVLALPLVPIFLWIVERRFVIPEENRLRRRFRADFARYAQKTRRWI